MNTFVDVFSDILVDFHAVVLVEGDLIWVQDVDSASDGSEISGEDVGLRNVIIRIGWAY